MKKVISCLLFCALLLFSVVQLNEFLIPKPINRYYQLEKYLEENPEQNLHDVQVFGSCHAYTSFNTGYFEARTGESAYVYANPSEITPVTYVRMVEQFKKHTPKVALVDTWGINPYETYIETEEIMAEYMPSDVELLPFSREKIELVNDFEEFDNLQMLFPISGYKERLTDDSLIICDFDYKFEETEEFNTPYFFEEMSLRFAHNGFKNYPYSPILEYPARQSVIQDGDLAEIEPIIVKYIQKIIDLCKEKDVELIFYRAPYVSTENELRKLNLLRQICEENSVLFVDMEDGVEYNYSTDFFDYEHLSEIGAARMTEVLSSYVIDALEKKDGEYSGTKHDAASDLLYSKSMTDNAPAFISEKVSAGEWSTTRYEYSIREAETGIRVTDRSGAYDWHYILPIEVPEDFAGKTLTAVYDITAFRGTNLQPVLSCRDENDLEICWTTSVPTKGSMSVSCIVPEGTKYIRLGFFSMEPGHEWDFVTFSGVQLYDGAYCNVNAKKYE